MQALGHICVDMQKLFLEDTPWHAPWMARVLPAIEEVTDRMASRTVFTRFLPPDSINAARGYWKNYYSVWPEMVAGRLSPELLNLVPSLLRLAPHGIVVDKMVFSPWWSGGLQAVLQRWDVAELVITGGETDVCVLATVLGAIDLGYRVYLPLDALFGSADPTHDAVLDIYNSRFQSQLVTIKVSDLADLWRENGL